KLEGSDHDFPRDVVELQNYFSDAPTGLVRAVPGAGLNVPIWLLGSSLFSAQLAGILGLPYAFASHFAPDHLMDALAIYRSEFRPSQQLAKPYVMVGTSVVGADSEEEARRLFTSQQVQSVQMMRGEREKIAPPVEDIEAYWVPPEREAVDHKLRYAFVGTVSSLADGLGAFIEETQADELIATVRIFDQSASLRSLEILAVVGQALASGRPDLVQVV
ncbi:MAG: MsnO8 family LLM class oxidoreductase, partial [Candidatus Latescibacterota bacterium]|nr:MsnO8 family LLM class oxidoreductase [Candidatus Latescibacterota bacterium]